MSACCPSPLRVPPFHELAENYQVSLAQRLGASAAPRSGVRYSRELGGIAVILERPPEQAEGMPCGIKHDPDIILRLIVGKLSPLLDRPSNTNIQIIHSYIEMNHHLLLSRRRRPDRSKVLRL